MWKAVDKPKDFNPMERWNNWDRYMHERFNWIAGHYMEALGYEIEQYNTNKFIWELRNRTLYVKWEAGSIFKTNYCQLKQAFMADRAAIY